MEVNKGENYLGNVVRIISNKELIIDVGEEDLTVGDKVQIYTVFDELTDLEGNSLGPYENIKETLDVVQTSKNYSVCKKIVTKKSSSYAILSSFSNVEYKVAEKLNINEEDIKPLTEYKDDKEIHVGDYVKKYW